MCARPRRDGCGCQPTNCLHSKGVQYTHGQYLYIPPRTAQYSLASSVHNLRGLAVIGRRVRRPCTIIPGRKTPGYRGEGRGGGASKGSATITLARSILRPSARGSGNIARHPPEVADPAAATERLETTASGISLGVRSLYSDVNLDLAPEERGSRIGPG